MPARPIIIGEVVSGKLLNQQMLEGCYFYEMEKNVFSLFSKADVLLAHGLKNKQGFQFNLGPFIWEVGNDFAIDSKGASGTWSADVPRVKSIKPPTDHDAEDEGSFQAQAGGKGGGADEKTAAAAAHKAH